MGSQIISLSVRGSQPRVLVADDYEGILLVVELVLSHHALVIKASSAQQAVELASEQVFAAILLDVNMGHGSTGLQVAADLRCDSVNRNTPIVLLTGDHSVEAKMRAVTGPACQMLFKPFKATTLLDTVVPLLSPERAPFGAAPSGNEIAQTSSGRRS